MATPKKTKDVKKAAAPKAAAKPSAKDGGKASPKPAAATKAVTAKPAKASPVIEKKPPAAAAKSVTTTKPTATVKDAVKEKEPMSKPVASTARKDKATSTSAKAAPAKAVEPVAEPAPKQRPKLSAEDRQRQAQTREALVARRDELLSLVQSNRAQMAGKAGDSADVSDRASEGFEDELAAGLIAIEAAKLDDIDDAIARIDRGDYGYCIVCDKPIPQKRLEFLPFAKRCITCEGSHERTRQVQSAYEEADDND